MYSGAWARRASQEIGSYKMSPKAKTELTRTGISRAPLNIQRREELDQGALALLDTALERQDGAAFLNALHVIVRAHGFAAVARKTGLNRTWLYKAISASGNPGLHTILSLLRALGLRLCVQAHRKGH